jgi:hypothetical protein
MVKLIAIGGAAQYNQPTAVEDFANAHGSGQAGGRLWLHCLQVGGRTVAQDRGEPVAAKERMGTTIAGAEGDKMAKGDQGDEFLGALLASWESSAPRINQVACSFCGESAIKQLTLCSLQQAIRRRGT